MSEFFIVANSFAAPMFSDDSDGYVQAENAVAALEKFAAQYKHPFGLYAAQCWASADDYHKDNAPLAEWLSNNARVRKEATKDKGSYSFEGHGPGAFTVDGKRYTVDDPKGGRVEPAAPPAVPGVRE